VDGAQNGTVFTVDAGVTARFQNLTIADGFSETKGGGILNDGTLIVTTSTVSDNVASSTFFIFPAGGGGISNDGALTVSNSTFSANVSVFIGAGDSIDNSRGTASLKNTILAGPVGPLGGRCSGTIGDAGLLG
jgi:hypothetical protein